MPGSRRLAITNSDPIATEKARHRGHSVDMLCKAFFTTGREPSLVYQHQAYYRRLKPGLEKLRSLGHCSADIQVHSHKHRYAGTIDLLCLGNFPIVAEIKTKRQLSEQFYHDDLLQLAAYIQAYKEMRGLLQVDGLLLVATTSELLVHETHEAELNVLFAEFLSRLRLFLSLGACDDSGL